MSRRFCKRLSVFLVFAMIFTYVFNFGSIKSVKAETYADDLFISEYIEGGGSNKAIEIYNGTEGAVELSEYKLELYFNGNSTTESAISVQLDGTIESGDVYVVANGNADQTILNESDKIDNRVINFNGDDALVLKYNEEVIDCIGKVGEDPGKYWGSNDCTTKDHTLIRKSSTTYGDTIIDDEFDPSMEWDVYPKDTFDYLGYHDMDGFEDDEEKVETVTASPEPGEVEEGTEVTLSTSTEGAVIYYTTDGNDPTIESDEFNADSPILISEDTTVKAFAVKEGYEDSNISVFNYTIKQQIEVMTIAEARNCEKGTEVLVEGIVTSIPGSYGGKSFYIQDDTSGAYIYTNEAWSAVIGNKVRVQGTTDEYNGKFEIVPSSIEVIDEEINEVQPVEITVDRIDEEYEGQVITINKAKVTNIESDKYNNAWITVIDASDNEGTVKLDSRTGQDYDDLDFEVDDNIDVIGIVDQSSSNYRILLRSLDDITKVSLGPDTQAPTITHTPVTQGNIAENLEIKAAVSDDRNIEYVKLYYRVKGTEQYNEESMTESNGQYTAVINKSELSTAGIEYYIEASDGTNSTTDPEDISTPYDIIISDEVQPDKVEDVTASPEPGEVEEGTEVTLSTSTEGAVIYYTTDGNDPTIESDEFNAESPIVISADTTVKAFAVKAGYEDSDISTFNYTIKQQSEVMTIAEARNCEEGTEVFVEGIVTSIPGSYGSGDDKSFYVQDDTSGAYIYTKIESNAVIGNKVRVQGITDEYNGKFEIVPSSIEVIDEEINEVQPVEITIDRIDEEYEGQVIAINNVKVTSIESDKYKNAWITISDGNNEGKVKLDSRTGQSFDDIDFEVDDNIDVIGIVDQSSSNYRILLRSLDDITKVAQTPDTQAPIITHTPVTQGNINKDLEIKTTVSDDRNIEYVKLYYRVNGTEQYNEKSMTESNGQYTAVIDKSELSTVGIEYYIEASDGTNTSTVPVDTNSPYAVQISDEDITAPNITNIKPENGSNVGDNYRPEISAKYSDSSNIKTESIKLYLDEEDVTEGAEINSDKITYVPQQDLSEDTHNVKLEVEDTKGNKASKAWSFTVGEEEYNIYFGELHSHTNISDGQGSLDDAYKWARDNAKADFFAVTDHSNWFDNESQGSFFNEDGSENDCSVSEEWVKMHETADKYNEDGKFAAMAGYEMTWSGSTGGWGHINTFNTKGFETRSHNDVDLEAYYDMISNLPDSISQLNHPGKTFGDFADFGYYSTGADAAVTLIEVGNGEGPVRGSGYFPSYEYYTRALDKGWHVAPTNNEDNHKGNWVNANTARTAVLAQTLSREAVYDAMRNRRVYATEDENMRIMYTINGQIMGSILDEPENLNVVININDLDEDEEIGTVSIIANGGTVVDYKTFEDNSAEWNLQLDPQYDYYYIKIDQEDMDIAVTAPIWTSKVTPVGLSNITSSQNIVEVNKSLDLKAVVYNNGNKVLSKADVEFYKNEVKEENKIGEDTVLEVEPGKTEEAGISWTPDSTGNYKIYAVAKMEGYDKVFTVSTEIEVLNKEDIVKVVIDAGHVNHYVSGSYAGKITDFKEMLKDKKMMAVEDNDGLTAEDLIDADILVITSPQPTDYDKYKLKKSKLSDEEIMVVKAFVDNGGSLIITTRADYKDGEGDYQNAVQGNKVLEAVGSNLRFNDAEVVDNTTNEGQEYRLMFDNFVSSIYNLTEGEEVSDYKYSFYSGAPVMLKENAEDSKVDFLVKGHETTEIKDADNAGDYTPTDIGEVYVLAAEVLNNGAKIIVSGSTFFSDFEVSGDNINSNIKITENILDWLTPKKEVELKSIKDVRIDEDKDGIPDLLGKRFAVEGYVTAQSTAVENPKDNAFFDVIYVQDETGGITVFGVSETAIPLGTKVRVTGYVDHYIGDTEIQISDEAKDIEILDENPKLIKPILMTTHDSMLEEYEGWLVKVKGIVTRIEGQNIYVDDGSGEARVYVEGYIGDGTGNEGTKGKWDSSIKAGDMIRAIGLASEDAEGHRLRVRNTAEIDKVTSDVSIENLSSIEEVEKGKDATITVKATNLSDLSKDVTLIVALYDENNTFINYAAVSQNLDPEEYTELTASIKILSNGETVRCFVWDNLDDMNPLTELIEIPVK